MATRRPGNHEDSRDKRELMRLSDPDEYNIGRRYRQLHNSKEAVVSVKDRTVEQAANGDIPPVRRDRFVVEKVIDYIRELKPLLEKQGRSEELLGEDVGSVSGQTITLGTIIDTHGKIPEDSDGEGGELWIPYHASMEAWSICNRYFEQIAGGEYENKAALPEDNVVDPAGRLEND